MQAGRCLLRFFDGARPFAATAEQRQPSIHRIGGGTKDKFSQVGILCWRRIESNWGYPDIIIRWATLVPKRRRECRYRTPTICVLSSVTYSGNNRVSDVRSTIFLHPYVKRGRVFLPISGEERS